MAKFSQIEVNEIDLNKIQLTLNPLIDAFNNAQSFAEQDKIFKKVNKEFDELQTDISIIYVRYTINTQDEKYAKLQEKIDEVNPYISEIANKFNKSMVESKFRSEFENKYGNHLFKMIDNALKCFSPEIIPELQEINKLGSEYTSILAGAQIKYKGQVYNLTQLSKFAESVDRKVRKEVAKLSAKFFEEHDEKIGEIYDKLVKLRTAMAHKLGFE